MERFVWMDGRNGTRWGVVVRRPGTPRGPRSPGRVSVEFKSTEERWALESPIHPTPTDHSTLESLLDLAREMAPGSSTSTEGS